MFRKFMILLLALSTANFAPWSPHVFAEQPSFDKYRQLISSGRFYMEYTSGGDFTVNKPSYRTIGLAVDGAKTMIYSAGYGVISAVAYVPVIGGLLGGTGFKLNRNYYFDAENYYAINSKKEVVKISIAQIQDRYINPRDAVAKSMIDANLKILDTFGMFTGDSQISFVESGQRAVDKKGKLTLDYDKYVKELRNAEGANTWRTFFYVYYNAKGELAGIDEITVEADVDADYVIAKALDSKSAEFQSYDVIHTVIHKLTETFPKDAFTLPDKAKIYEPWMGDMNDLLEQRVPAES